MITYKDKTYETKEEALTAVFDNLVRRMEPRRYGFSCGFCEMMNTLSRMLGECLEGELTAEQICPDFPDSPAAALSAWAGKLLWTIPDTGGYDYCAGMRGALEVAMQTIDNFDAFMSVREADSNGTNGK